MSDEIESLSDLRNLAESRIIEFHGFIRDHESAISVYSSYDEVNIVKEELAEFMIELHRESIAKLERKIDILKQLYSEASSLEEIDNVSA